MACGGEGSAKGENHRLVEIHMRPTHKLVYRLLARPRRTTERHGGQLHIVCPPENTTKAQIWKRSGWACEIQVRGQSTSDWGKNGRRSIPNLSMSDVSFGERDITLKAIP